MVQVRRATLEDVPRLLVTSKAGNVAYYERRGFVIAEEAQAPEDGPLLWFMRCDVGDTGSS